MRVSETEICYSGRTGFVAASGDQREETLGKLPSEHSHLYLMQIYRMPHFTYIERKNRKTSLSIALINNGHYSHLRGPSPPALVSHAEAAQALSLGHLVLPRAFVLPAGHRGRSFLLQLRQMLHTAVHLQGNTVRSIIIWSLSY